MLRNFTQCDEKEALEYLKRANWKVDQASVFYFSDVGNRSNSAGSSSNASIVDRKKVEAMFQTYSKGSELIEQEGIMQLCQDLNVESTDLIVLILAWKLEAATMGQFSKAEWMKIADVLRCDSIAGIKSRFDAMKAELSQKEKFKKFYLWAFEFGKEPTQKSLNIQMAIPLWRLIYTGRFAFIDEWCSYLEEKAGTKAIPKDTWAVFFEFADTINSDMSNYDCTSAWPVLIDGFVEWFKANKRQ